MHNPTYAGVANKVLPCIYITLYLHVSVLKIRIPISSNAITILVVSYTNMTESPPVHSRVSLCRPNPCPTIVACHFKLYF